MWDLLTTADAWLALFTLIAMEVVLGIDNIVFLSIVVDRLPKEQQARARTIGLLLALVARVGLLLAISWVMGLTVEVFSAFGESFSGRDLILLGGGAFLVGKATHEIFARVEEQPAEDGASRRATYGFNRVLVEIVILDLVFSLDSVITAVGMTDYVPVMVAAILVSIVIMIVFAGAISDFINGHPSMRVLALSFLILIGVFLVADGLGQKISKGYIYFAMAYALGVELINMRLRRRRATS